ncbi:MAG: ATP synthase F1 subunit gamma [Desulfobacterales bacterium]|jgi:F-type H+-transporting ATPase subunit gamma|nr:ATP synthase F1 subunit gamma [Desulfobacterales bacterium]
MATLKDVKNKIKAVKKTKQITKAMNMVAASKLRSAQSNMEAFRPYARKFAEVLGNLAERAGEGASPLLVPREEVKKIHIVLCTSDRGLCGGFNTNLLEKAEAFMRQKSGAGVHFALTAFGRKARNWSRKTDALLADEYLGIMGTAIKFNEAATAGRKLVQSYLDGSADEVYIIYAEFLSTARQVPVLKKLLPIPPIEKAEAEAPEAAGYLPEHICEPSAAELLGEMLPRNIYVQLFSALLETSASEHAARMVAMDNATKACNDMIGNLTLAFNKARQSAITAELMDIVGGAEALKG